MAENAELRERLESALNRLPTEAIGPPDDEIAVSWPIAAYTVTEQARITVFDDLRGTTRCTSASVLDVGGSSATGANGRTEISLNGFHCFAGPTLGYEHPVNVVATSREDKPTFLSVQTKFGTDSNGYQDVLITVFAWTVTGDPSGGTPFRWRCMVPYYLGPE